ncbi:MAG: subfamily B ATP-binding cassette protein MsbA, partial [Polaribacter sp.]
MGYFKDILKYEKKYRKFTVLNILFNILYAIFNVLSVLAFIPVLRILFSTDKEVIAKPIYIGLSGLGSYLENSFNYLISQ